MPPADGSHHFPEALPSWLLNQFGQPDADGCWGGLSLADMTHDFGPVEETDEDEEDTIDLSDLAMVREHGFYS